MRLKSIKERALSVNFLYKQLLDEVFVISRIIKVDGKNRIDSTYT